MNAQVSDECRVTSDEYPAEKVLLFEVFAPELPLCRSRRVYKQFTDGTAQREFHVPGRAGDPYRLGLDLSEVFPSAMDWARIFHSGKPRFPDNKEAEEVYGVLCNAALAIEQGDIFRARVCVEGMVKDCNEWLRRLPSEEEKEAA